MKFPSSLSACHFIFLLAFFVSITSCSEDALDEDELQQPETEEEVPIDNVARLEAKNLYSEFYLASKTSGSDIAWTGDEPSCDPGIVTEPTRAKILQRLDYYRKAVGLNNIISENMSKSDKAQLAALIMNANDQLDHDPPSSWKCYSAEGNEGAGNSLLTMTRNAEAIDSYIRDQGSDNGPVGHRRWLLWPRLQEIGIGNTNKSNAIWVLGNAGTPPSDAPEFVSWPPEGYIPDRLVFPRWSFSIAGADFSGTTISMLDENQNSISLQLEELSNSYGDRTIVWIPENINTNVTADTNYTVTLRDVEVNGVLMNYSYQVTLFDPTS
jgi:hypothetical protein